MNMLGHGINDVVIANFPFVVLSCHSETPSVCLVWMATTVGIMSVDVAAPPNLLTPVPVSLDCMAHLLPFSMQDRVDAFTLSKDLGEYYNLPMEKMLKYRREILKPPENVERLRWTRRPVIERKYTPLVMKASLKGAHTILTMTHDFYIDDKGSITTLPFKASLTCGLTKSSTLVCWKEGQINVFLSPATVLASPIGAGSSTVIMQPDPVSESSMLMLLDNIIYTVRVIK